MLLNDMLLLLVIVLHCCFCPLSKTQTLHYSHRIKKCRPWKTFYLWWNVYLKFPWWFGFTAMEVKMVSRAIRVAQGPQDSSSAPNEGFLLSHCRSLYFFPFKFEHISVGLAIPHLRCVQT